MHSVSAAHGVRMYCACAQCETHILVLKQFRDAKEERRGLLSAKRFTNVQQVDDFGQQDATFSGRDGSLVEHASLLDDRLRSRDEGRNRPVSVTFHPFIASSSWSRDSSETLTSLR